MEHSGIGWTDNTFNYIIGCQKVAPECKNCYALAETRDRYYPGQRLWGPVETSTRRTLSDAYWKKPYTWERKAIKTGEALKVFASSWADVCEDHPIANQERVRLIRVIEETPHLIWQLLTKRPMNYTRMFWPFQLPSHVWAMTSAGSPGSAEEMLPPLMQIDAAIRGVSVGPFIENFSIVPYLPELDWVVIEGESGDDARPMDLRWMEQMIADCQNAGVAVFIKQLGSVWSRSQGRGNHHGTIMSQWPKALQIQQFPSGPRANRRTPYSGIQKESYVTR